MSHRSRASAYARPLAPLALALAFTLALAPALVIAMTRPAIARPPGPAGPAGPSGASQGSAPGPTSTAAKPAAAAPLALPRLKTVTPRESQAAWMGVKALSPARQTLGVETKRLLEATCSDLIDMRALVDKGLMAGFGFRDTTRQRGWARPTLALLLVEAMKRFLPEAEKLRRGRVEKLVSIGDISQVGCGQLHHGVLVFEATGARAAELRSKARLVEGRPTQLEIVRAADFPWEADRFGPPDERVLIVTELHGVRGEALRYARTRYRELPPPSADELAGFAREVEALLLTARPTPVRKLSEVDGAAKPEERWVSWAIDPKTRRQARVVTTTKPGRRLDWSSVVEVRLAHWQDKKPGSFPGEVRWRAEGPAQAQAPSAPEPPPPRPGARRARPSPPPPAKVDAVRWTRWSLVNEAGHISHLSGIDADLSYVTTNNDRHFAVDLAAMDVELTWRWLETLVATGKELGTPVESILVDARIKRHLMDTLLPRSGSRTKKPLDAKTRAIAKSPVWRLLTLVGGHDAHHHVRIGEATDAQERRARQRLGL